MKKLFSCGALLSALVCSAARGGVTADLVMPGYNAGTLSNGYTNTAAALGGLDALAGDGVSDTSIMTPFNAPYATTRYVGMQGATGQLTLHLSAPISIAPGAKLGVHSGAGLQYDFNNPVIQNFPTAGNYTSTRTSTLKVSFDDVTFSTVAADHVFRNPSNFYDQGITDPGFTTTPGTHAADQFQPFLGTIASFNGKDWPGTLAVLNGSAGGDWFDLSGVGLTAVNYVQFDTSANQTMYVDAVVGVPEPGTLSLLGVGLLLLKRRR